MAQNWTLQSFTESARTWTIPRTLHIACHLNLFDGIPPDGIDARQLAFSMELHTRALEVFCNALTSLELLEKRKEKYFLTDFSKKYLLSSSEYYIGYLIKHQYELMASWMDFEKVLKTGKPVNTLMNMAKKPDEAKLFTLTMHTISALAAPKIVKLVDLSPYHKLLDIGGGPGTYAIHFCKEYPQLLGAVLDLPAVLSVSKDIVKKYGMSARFSFIPANYNRDPLPQGYDVALLSNIIHIESHEMNGQLIKKVYDSLKSPGLIIIQDYMMNQELTEPTDAALFALTMLIKTEKGRCYSFNEVENWLSYAGFKNIREIKPTLPERRATLILGYK